MSGGPATFREALGKVHIPRRSLEDFVASGKTPEHILRRTVAAVPNLCRAHFIDKAPDITDALTQAQARAFYSIMRRTDNVRLSQSLLMGTSDLIEAMGFEEYSRLARSATRDYGNLSAAVIEQATPLLEKGYDPQLVLNSSRRLKKRTDLAIAYVLQSENILDLVGEEGYVTLSKLLTLGHPDEDDLDAVVQNMASLVKRLGREETNSLYAGLLKIRDRCTDDVLPKLDELEQTFGSDVLPLFKLVRRKILWETEQLEDLYNNLSLEAIATLHNHDLIGGKVRSQHVLPFYEVGGVPLLDAWSQLFSNIDEYERNVDEFTEKTARLLRHGVSDATDYFHFMSQFYERRHFGKGSLFKFLDNETLVDLPFKSGKEVFSTVTHLENRPYTLDERRRGKTDTHTLAVEGVKILQESDVGNTDEDISLVFRRIRSLGEAGVGFLSIGPKIYATESERRFSLLVEQVKGMDRLLGVTCSNVLPTLYKNPHVTIEQVFDIAVDFKHRHYHEAEQFVRDANWSINQLFNAGGQELVDRAMLYAREMVPRCKLPHEMMSALASVHNKKGVASKTYGLAVVQAGKRHLELTERLLGNGPEDNLPDEQLREVYRATTRLAVDNWRVAGGFLEAAPGIIEAVGVSGMRTVVSQMMKAQMTLSQKFSILCQYSHRAPQWENERKPYDDGTYGERHISRW